MQSLEPYIFHYFVHTFALRVHCEQRIEMYDFCVNAAVALIDASLSVGNGHNTDKNASTARLCWLYFRKNSRSNQSINNFSDELIDRSPNKTSV